MSAEIVPIESVYFGAARQLRARANNAGTMGRAEDAKSLKRRSQQLDGLGFAIKAKTDALARAEALNATAP